MVFISGELQIYANQNGQWLYNCLFQYIKPWTSNCQVESLNYHRWNFFSKCISKMYDFSREKFTRLFINLMTFIPGYVATRKTSSHSEARWSWHSKKVELLVFEVDCPEAVVPSFFALLLFLSCRHTKCYISLRKCIYVKAIFNIVHC